MEKYIIAERNVSKAKKLNQLTGLEFRVRAGPYNCTEDASKELESVYKKVAEDAQTRSFDRGWMTVSKTPTVIKATSMSGRWSQIENEWVFYIVDQNYLENKIWGLTSM